MTVMPIKKNHCSLQFSCKIIAPAVTAATAETCNLLHDVQLMSAFFIAMKDKAHFGHSYATYKERNSLKSKKNRNTCCRCSCCRYLQSRNMYFMKSLIISAKE